MGTAPLTFITAIPSALIFVPISIYANIKLYKHKNQTFMQKRSLPIVFGLNIAFIAMIILYPMVPIIFFNFPLAFSVMAFMLVFIVWWILLLFLNVRNWMIYFKSHWTYNTVQLEWQEIINPNIKNKKNWFIDNNKKYGNISNVFKLFFVAHLIGFVLSMIGVFIRVTGYTSNHSTILTVLSIPIIIILLSIPIIFYCVILCKTPTFDSCHVYIHWESKIQSKLLIITIIMFLTGMVIAEIVGFYIASSILSPSMSLMFFMMNYISTFSLIAKNMDSALNERRPSVTETDEVDIRLNDVLSHKKAVHLFMVYLTTEFSIECLLSFIEMAQFEKYILDLMDDDDPQKMMGLTLESVIKHSNVPQSVIIEKSPSLRGTESMKKDSNYQRLYDAKMKAHGIYNKYIKIGSEFEINISSNIRRKLVNILDDKNKLMVNNMNLCDLVLLFERSKDDMKRLLNYSYFRYKQHVEYEQIVKIFTNKKNMNAITPNKKMEEQQQQQQQMMDDTEIVYGDTPTNDREDDGIEVVYNSNNNDEDDDKRHSTKNSIQTQLQLAITKSNTPRGYVSMEEQENY